MDIIFQLRSENTKGTQSHIVFETNFPKIIESFINRRMYISCSSIVHNYKVREEDLKEVIRFTEDILFILSSRRRRHTLEEEIYYLEIIGKGIKEGFARKSGNGSVITLPNDWKDKKIIAILTDKDSS